MSLGHFLPRDIRIKISYTIECVQVGVFKRLV